ncbi:MAG: Crp/Fnr family transcriptional regulator [Hyphomicrobiaceae bacterium]|nr:Crp/Fnr family transcriptional regulator [Hyphomicrobiaceae bacterium]
MTSAKPSRRLGSPPRFGSSSLTPLGGIRHRLGRRQQLVLGPERPESAYFVESGCLLVEALLSGDRRQVALALFPGDVISRSAVPPLPDIAIMAAVPSVVIRLGERTDAAESDGLSRPPMTHFARLAARYAMHAIALNRLTAEERLATLLLELTFRLGQRTHRGCTFDLPMSRSDMAHFLALNPDTLSRLMSRLKGEDLLSTTGRGQVTVHDLQRLAARTPLAAAVQSLCPVPSCGLEGFGEATGI